MFFFAGEYPKSLPSFIYRDLLHHTMHICKRLRKFPSNIQATLASLSNFSDNGFMNNVEIDHPSWSVILRRKHSTFVSSIRGLCIPVVYPLRCLILVIGTLFKLSTHAKKFCCLKNPLRAVTELIRSLHRCIGPIRVVFPMLSIAGVDKWPYRSYRKSFCDVKRVSIYCEDWSGLLSVN